MEQKILKPWKSTDPSKPLEEQKTPKPRKRINPSKPIKEHKTLKTQGEHQSFKAHNGTENLKTMKSTDPSKLMEEQKTPKPWKRINPSNPSRSRKHQSQTGACAALHREEKSPISPGLPCTSAAWTSLELGEEHFRLNISILFLIFYFFVFPMK